MQTSPQDREFDVVLFGATGFTGSLTAQQLADRMPTGGRWALAGRHRNKLEQTRAALGPQWADLPLLVADSHHEHQLAELAARTRVLASTVGPYLEHGDALVGACAAAGTDYLDLTGEAEFVDRCWMRHHATAQKSGARLVHACGFDSIPHDLGAQFLVEQFPDLTSPLTARGVVRTGGTLSGGTLASALMAMSRAQQAKAAKAERRDLETRPTGRRARAVGGRPHRDKTLGYWLLPLPTLDPTVIVQSARALPQYGPDFTYSHWAGTKTLRYAVAGALGVMGLVAAAQVPMLRRALSRRLAPGQGPDQARRDRAWFTVDLIGRAAGRTVHVKVSGGDPGYSETSKMLASAALCLAFDDLPATSGQVTTAVAMGPVLRRRLEAAGMRFEVLSAG